MSRLLALCLAVCLAGAEAQHHDPFVPASGSVASQTKIEHTWSPVMQDAFGAATAGLGDHDGDGVPDVVVGVPRDDDGALDAGAVRILFLDADGTLKGDQKISGVEGGFRGALASGDNLGASVTSLGDLDGDGIGDIAVGAPGTDDQGVVWIFFLFADGTVKDYAIIDDVAAGITFIGAAPRFGAAVAGLGDLDGDGVEDLAVGAPGEVPMTNQPDFGSVWVLFLNPDGSVSSSQQISANVGGLVTIPNTIGEEFGHAITCLGDVDGDGVRDLAVGAPNGGLGLFPPTVSGSVWILLMNTDGTVDSGQEIGWGVGGFTPAVFPLRFGHAATGPGDLDHDGVPDLVVGAPLTDEGGTARGAAWFLRLASDGTLASASHVGDGVGGFTGVLDDDDRFGSSLGAIGDLDGDGVADLAVGAPLDDGAGAAPVDHGAVWLTSLDHAPCREGGAGADVLSVNGATVGLTAAPSTSLTFDLQPPPASAGPTAFALWGASGVPGAADVFATPAGDLCFTPAPVAAGQPGLFTLVTSFDAASPAVLPSPAPAPWSFTWAPGLPHGIDFTLQGVVEDAPGSLVTTNAVSVRTRAAPAPEVVQVSPPSAPAGATISLGGSFFVSGATVTVAGIPVSPMSIMPHTITFVNPAGVPCDTTVVVMNPDGQASSIAFNPTPVIDSTEGTQGLPIGGFPVTVHGSQFVPGTVVTIGGTVASPSVFTSTMIVVTAPPGVAGTTTLDVTAPSGCAATVPFVYGPFPHEILAVNPLAAPAGATITVIGTNFTPNHALTVDGLAVTPVTLSESRITYVNPPGVGCDAVVAVTNSIGQAASHPFNPTPVITGALSPQGPVSGGVPFTILGELFVPSTTVTIGGVPATVLITSPWHIQLLTPPGVLGPAPVVVTAPQGCTASTTYTYLAPAPVITSVSPASAPVGATVTVTGTDFDPALSLTLDGQPVIPTSVTPGQVVFTNPGAPCDATLAVTHPDGQTASSTFNPAPVIGALAPSSGVAAGGTTLFILGSFPPGTTLTIDGVPHTILSAGAFQLITITSAGSPGPVDVTVTTPGGCDATATYTYF